mmetsp:Transcript_14653/g.26376  ORF Transcript_14653/g.26376 Transcript_14653/m.26376 type:complete len:92 (+) Transcript_14653:22-297(+)
MWIDIKILINLLLTNLYYISVTLVGIILMGSVAKPVVVIKIIGRKGSKGEITQVRVRLLTNSKRTIVRNIVGAVRLGDIILLNEIERDQSY